MGNGKIGNMKMVFEINRLAMSQYSAQIYCLYTYMYQVEQPANYIYIKYQY